MLEIMSKEVRELLEDANCPECDGKGSYYYWDFDNLKKCLWCFKRKEVLNFDKTSGKD